MRNSYLIISPGRNEEKFIRRTLESVVSQSVQPSRWILVDDGSTDGTGAIMAEYAEKYPFIQVVTKDDRGTRSVGPGVVEAFYAGLATVDLQEFDFICKLDLDLDLPEKYFELLLERMADNPRLGCCSGKPYYIDKKSGILVSEKCGDENSIGASKFYRKECFLQIGGFVRQVMWDGIDGHRCRMLGWIARSWDEPCLHFIHLRPMGSSHKGLLRGRTRHGEGQYFMGTGLVYMSISTLYRMTRPPLIWGGLAMWYGYIRSLIVGVERLDDPYFRKFLRSYQWACLLRGKKRATAHLDECGAEVWNPQRVDSPFATSP